MAIFNIKPPRIQLSGKNNGFWRQIGMIVIGATISLVLTIVAAKFLEDLQRKKDRHLMVLMVTNNIDDCWRTLEAIYTLTGRADSVAQWLLSHPIEELEMLPEKELQALVDEASDLYAINYDNTTQEIFSHSIDTWKNMRNYQYINIAGLCFAKISSTSQKWNHWGDELENLRKDVHAHPDQYPGFNTSSKFLRNEEARQMLAEIHQHRCWLLHQSEILHYENKKGMAIMGITDKELQKFYEKIADDPVVDMEVPSIDYDITPLNPDSLTTLRNLDERLEQLK